MSRVGRLASRLLEGRRIARTLYHGTTVDNEASIRQMGLMGSVGSFVQEAYAEWLEAGDPLEDLVFAADKRGLNTALTAMIHHISKKLGKDFHAVTDKDILNHGLLVIIHDPENKIEQRPEEDENHRGDYPSQVEPGDYFSEEMWADKFVKGRALLRLLERYGQWPRTYGPWYDIPARLNKMRGELIARWLRENPTKTKQEALTLVQGLPDKKVLQYFDQYISGG